MNGTMIPTSQQMADAGLACGNAILLFRMGDFYEAFDTHASIISRKLGLTITRKGERLMAGFPYHHLESYLHKLVKEGERVAICEQPREEAFTLSRIPKPVLWKAPQQPKARQAVLFSGLDCIAGQNDLFPTDGPSAKQ